MIHVAVLGYGTVGSGVVEVIEGNKALINKRSLTEINVKYILDLLDFPGDPYEDKIVHSIDVIVDDPEASRWNDCSARWRVGQVQILS